MLSRLVYQCTQNILKFVTKENVLSILLIA